MKDSEEPEEGWLTKKECVKECMKSLSLSQEDAQFRNKWRREIKRATWKMAAETCK